MAEISVIIPVYNVEKYLSKCIDSVISQTFKDLEIILIDDGSKDNCSIICDEYSKIDSRIKVIHKKNGGLSSARNAGLKEATGKYIGFVDSDDWIESSMYETLYNIMEEYKSDIVQCRFLKTENENADRLLLNSSEKNIEIINNIQALNNLYNDRYVETVVVWNKLYRKNLFENLIFPENKIHEDEFIIHKLLYKSEKVILCDQIMYYYRKTDKSIINSGFSEKKLHKLEAVKERADFFKEIKNKNLYKKTLIHYKDLLIEYFFLCKVYLYKDPFHMKKIKHEYRKIFFRYLVNTDRKVGDRIMGFAFWLSPTLYFILHIKWLNKLIGIMRKRIQYTFSFIYYKNYKEYKNRKKIIHMLTPTYGNMGDQAIVYSTNLFFKEFYNEYEVIEIYGEDVYKTAKSLKKILKRDDFIVLAGGGNMNNIWIDEEMRRRFIIKTFHKNRIISMPQTISFTDDVNGKKELIKSERVYNGHKNLTVIAREKKSYDIMKDILKKSRILLNPDMVFFLNNMYKHNEYKRENIMVCFRKDAESVLGENRKLLIDRINEDYDNVVFSDTVINKKIYKETREIELKNTLKKFLKSKIVITDRLHGMIFSVITNTPCIVIKSCDHKISGTLEWIKGLNYIEFIEDLDYDFIRLLINKLCSLEKISSIDFHNIYFDQLRNKLDGKSI